ncbi:MAG: type II CAAX endopeptidase family protein [Acidobacteriota bacterium]
METVSLPSSESVFRVLLRLFFYLLGFVVAQMPMFLLVLLFRLMRWPAAAALLLGAPLYALAVLFLTRLFRRRFDRRPWSGMAVSPFRGRLAAGGFLLGAAMMASVFALEAASGWLRLTGFRHGLAVRPGVLAELAAVFVLFAAVGFTEELAMRGYFLQNLGERFPVWIATIAAGVVFGALHFTYDDFGIAFVASAVVLTAFLTASRLLTGSLWLAIGWHAGWDWLQTAVLGIREIEVLPSGGAFLAVERHGPPLFVGRGAALEAGLLSIFVELAGLVAILLLARRRGGIRWGSRLTPAGTPSGSDQP